MKLPEREYYTPEELAAERWAHMSVSLIEHLIDTGKLKPAWYILEDYPDNSEDPTLSDDEIASLHRIGHYKALENYERQYKWFDERPSHDPHSKYTHIKLDEIRRFEMENGITDTSSEKDTITLAIGNEATDAENRKAVRSLLILVATMAIKGYKYNPKEKKSTIPREITDDAESLGLSIDEKTVRKWLREAVTTHIDQDKLQ